MHLCQAFSSTYSANSTFGGRHFRLIPNQISSLFACTICELLRDWRFWIHSVSIHSAIWTLSQLKQPDRPIHHAAHLCHCASSAAPAVTPATAEFWAQLWASSPSPWPHVWSGPWVHSCTASATWRVVASWPIPRRWSTPELHPACPSKFIPRARIHFWFLWRTVDAQLWWLVRSMDLKSLYSSNFNFVAIFTKNVVAGRLPSRGLL